MHNFCLIFGCLMTVFFSILVLVWFLGLLGGQFTGTQVLLAIPLCFVGIGLSAELWDDGYYARQSTKDD